MNIQRFRQVLAYIEAHPEEWDQREWCGTQCCIAGHAMQQSGLAFDDRTWGGVVLIHARDWLEASPEEANWLFAADRHIDDFRTVARRPWA